ncbi:MAG: hypothetical protein Q7J35_09910 [Candidatus Methanoperedens sp.]|nr:hypothetical protein [Candidatus Methanoperedens sp.]
MSTERDIIIERLEQKLAAKDKEFEQMQESLRETIFEEIEIRFADKLKLRESTIDEIKIKLGQKVNDILEMNKSLRDSVLEQQNARSETERQAEERINRLERRLVELNSAFEGVMKELLDQKSIIQELKPKKPGREDPGARVETRKDDLMSATYKMHDKPMEVAKPREEVKQPEKPKPKNEYIVAENYVAKDKRKQQAIIEAEEIAEEIKKSDNKPEQKVLNKSMFKKSERVNEGVEIYENPKRGR